ncbi:MAG: methionine synthase [Candidatus Azobacteroides sp.]|nr:methionine synthase [Candidatus Azobacteroides sp.]
MMLFEQLLREKILILDGAMGTMIQRYNLREEDYRGSRFADFPGQLKGNNDLLSLVRPDIIRDIHLQYLEAGADIIETNSFNANAISLAEYGMKSYAREINTAAARIAREVVDQYDLQHPDKPRFVAGSMGPTNKTASISPDVSNPAFRNVTFDELYRVYKEQAAALIAGGVDVLLIETVFDTLNLKAALMAAEEAAKEAKKDIPLLISFTIAGKSGRILSGQTLEAAVASISHVRLLSIGLNCSFGVEDMKPFLKALEKIVPCYVSAHPNAGLPDSLGNYIETPETMAAQIQEYIEEGWVNILGGCCGTTPAHIAQIAQMAARSQCPIRQPRTANPNHVLTLSGLDILEIGNIPKEENTDSSSTIRPAFCMVGERCNVAGSRKFLRLIKEKKYDEALGIARKQVEEGAQILDINVDDGLLDGVAEMTTFLRLIASEPDVAAVPIMIDSSDWNIIEAGLKCLQGKSVVNSISLKNGEAEFLQRAGKIRSYGAAVVAMAFDEKGQADSFERKIEVCERMYRLLIDQAGFESSDIIFDPNVLAIATGMEEHNDYAVAYIRSIEWIKQNLPGAKVSGGISNLSFSFRGNDYLREVMHTVFLYHAIRKGLDMGIVNPSATLIYEDIPIDLRNLAEDVVLNRYPDAGEKLIEFARQHQTFSEQKADKQEEWRAYPVSERLKYALIKGNGDFLEADLKEALRVYSQPVDIIDQPLMEGMNTVGRLFGEGKMFLPQVVKTARTMKKAVAILQPALEANRKDEAAKAGKILIATVKGDVHDIGKNITGVILSCNNYEVIDIGVMIPPEEIIQKAREYEVDIVALSGLITPSLQEMSFVASEMEKAGFSIPLIIGGATTSKLHTALKIDPLYHGAVVHVPDASLAVPVVNKLLNTLSKEDYSKEVKESYRSLRDQATNKKEWVSLDYARGHSLKINWEKYRIPQPKTLGRKVIDFIPVEEVVPYVNWPSFLSVWKFPVRYAAYFKLVSEAEKAQWLLAFPENEKTKAMEAVRLMDDAQRRLSAWNEANRPMIKAIIGFYSVKVENDSLILETPATSEEGAPQKKIVPLLRQQEKREDDTYRSLSDFFHPAGDFIGLFVITAGLEAQGNSACCSTETEDAYQKLLEQTLRDRLVEAASEYLHEKVRKEYWGYSPDESFTPDELLKAPYPGIRPASGYPVHPDISLNFLIDDLLKMNQIGVSLTPNGAISPTASVAGMYIACPDADYFSIGKTDEKQLADYAQKKGCSIEETKKWLGW